MTALIIGNGENPKLFLVNGYDKTAIVENTRYPLTSDYVTTHFVRKDGDSYKGESFIPSHKGDVIYCSGIDVESIWKWEDRQRGVKATHSFQMPSMPPYPCQDEYPFVKETTPSTEFMALNYFLGQGYRVTLVGFPKSEINNHRYESRFISEQVNLGKVEVI